MDCRDPPIVVPLPMTSVEEPIPRGTLSIPGCPIHVRIDLKGVTPHRPQHPMPPRCFPPHLEPTTDTAGTDTGGTAPQTQTQSAPQSSGSRSLPDVLPIEDRLKMWQPGRKMKPKELWKYDSSGQLDVNSVWAQSSMGARHRRQMKRVDKRAAYVHKQLTQSEDP